MQSTSKLVTLKDWMGDDLTVINAARVSFNKESEWGLTPWGDYSLKDKFLKESDAKLIDYLAKHNHFSPFTHVQLQFHIKMPIFVARQFFKHTVGVSFNEVSRRYVDYTPEFFTPEVWRKRAENKKQGSSETETVTRFKNEIQILESSSSVFIDECVSDLYRLSLSIYNEMINSGVAPEQARMILPQSMFTEFYMTCSLYAAARIFNLRSQSDAQKEIQDYAFAIGELAKTVAPVSWSALCENNEHS